MQRATFRPLLRGQGARPTPEAPTLTLTLTLTLNLPLPLTLTLTLTRSTPSPRAACEAGGDPTVCEAAPRRQIELRQAQVCRYDNYAYTLLDAMVQRRTGRPLWRWSLQLIARPLGMHGTSRCMAGGGGEGGGGEGGGGEGGGEGAQEWPQQFCVKELRAFVHANPAWTLLI